MKTLLLFILLIAVAISGCMQKSPSGSQLSVDEIKKLSMNDVKNLSSYSFTSTVNQTLKFSAHRSNSTQGNETTILQWVENIASVNLTATQARVNSSTKNTIQLPGVEANTTTSRLTAFLIGNSTYAIGKSDRWIHLKDPRPANVIWNKTNNNPVKVLVDKINRSELEMMGSENIDDIETYKLKIQPGSDDYYNLYSTAFSVASQLAKYPLLVPSINGTELNKTSQMQMVVWMAKDTNLPVKYQSNVILRTTPVIIGGEDLKTGKMRKLDQPVIMGNVSIDSVTSYQYYDFNKPVEISPPEEALKVPPVLTTQTQGAGSH